MKPLHYVTVLFGLFSNLPVDGMPFPGSDIGELAFLFKEFKGQQLTNCDLSKAVMPTTDGPNSLSPPDTGLVISHIVLGRGTQNYSCADATDSSIPVSQGAVADLYDASCLAETKPELLRRLPGIMVNVGRTTIKTAVSIVSGLSCNDILAGHHYFAPNNTVPVFDFRIKKPQRWILMGTRDQSIPAITTASKGCPTEQNGAIDWLRIKAIPSLSVDFKLAYRVQTAGGRSPPTCKGMPKSFEIQYASEYWIYS